MTQLYFGLASDSSDVAILPLEEINGISKGGPPAEELRLSASEVKLALGELIEDACQVVGRSSAWRV